MRPNQIAPSNIFPGTADSDKKALQIAFGFVKRDEPKSALSLSTGTVSAFYRKRADNGNISRVPLTTHTCTEKEIGILEPEKSNFYASGKTETDKVIQAFTTQLNCFDE